MDISCSKIYTGLWLYNMPITEFYLKYWEYRNPFYYFSQSTASLLWIQYKSAMESHKITYTSHGINTDLKHGQKLIPKASCLKTFTGKGQRESQHSSHKARARFPLSLDFSWYWIRHIKPGERRALHQTKALYAAADKAHHMGKHLHNIAALLSQGCCTNSSLIWQSYNMNLQNAGPEIWLDTGWELFFI